MSARARVILTCDTVTEDCPVEFYFAGSSREMARDRANRLYGWTRHYPGAAKILDFCPIHSDREALA